MNQMRLPAIFPSRIKTSGSRPQIGVLRMTLDEDWVLIVTRSTNIETSHVPIAWFSGP
jgi:hypothetical protein